MNELPFQRPTLPITTGLVHPRRLQTPSNDSEKGKGPSFDQVLEKQRTSLDQLVFSKHATSRVEQRQVEVTADKLERLEQGLALARNKGLKASLILVDDTAFVVSVPNQTVITTLQGDKIKGNVFTNIDGTVII